MRHCKQTRQANSSRYRLQVQIARTESTMAEEKGNVVAPELNVWPPRYLDATAAVAAKPNKVKRYHVVIAVSVVVVTLIVVGGLLGGAMIFSKAVKDIAKFHVSLKDKQDGRNIEETVQSDTTDDIVTYHMKKDGVEQWVLNDFGKDITVYKIRQDGQTTCYVSPLNETEASRPEAVRENMKNVAETPEHEQAYYQSADEPIKNPAYLGKKVTEMCDGHDIYWVNPSCPSSESNGDGLVSNTTMPSEHSRSKRSLYYATRYGCCYRVVCCNAYLITYYANGQLVRCRFICSKYCPIYVSRYC